MEDSLKIDGTVVGEKKFSELLVEIPTKVSKQTACDLSVPIILNCLLHLANEKVMFLTAMVIFLFFRFFEAEPYRIAEPENRKYARFWRAYHHTRCRSHWLEGTSRPDDRTQRRTGSSG